MNRIEVEELLDQLAMAAIDGGSHDPSKVSSIERGLNKEYDRLRIMLADAGYAPWEIDGTHDVTNLKTSIDARYKVAEVLVAGKNAVDNSTGKDRLVEEGRFQGMVDIAAALNFPADCFPK
jgi:hypothetical protein